MPANHAFSDLYTQISPGSVFVIYLLILLILVVLRSMVICCKIKRCFSFKLQIDEIQVKQNLKNFFSALKTSDRESLIREEAVDSNRLQSSKMSKENLIDLVLCPKASHEFRLEGYPSYRILRHDLSEQFNYI